jgi:acyl CoA:acetate/3-ketoacid CoA transferase beta subunit
MHQAPLLAESQCDWTIDEIICVCISRQIEDGEMVAQGMATPLVAAGYMLAKLTHAPNISFASVIGNSLCLEGGALAMSRVESVWIGLGRRFGAFTDIVCSVLPSMHLKEFFRPAQVDSQGSTNNVVFGDHTRPRLRMPGAGGIPDLTAFSDRVYLYVPRHGKATFVPRLDFRSGVGVLSAAERQETGVPGPGPRLLVSDLGCFDFADGRMRLVSRHPGITAERIQAKTGFPLDVLPGCPETDPPTKEELRLLRQVIDPLGIRSVEVLGGGARWDKLREIARAEVCQGTPLSGLALPTVPC